MPSPLTSGLITMLDGSGTSGVIRTHLPSSIAATAALAGLADLAGAVAAISECSPVRLSVVYRVRDPNPTGPPSDSTAADVGLFIVSTADAQSLAILPVPGFDRSRLATVGCFAGEQIDLLNSDIAAFLVAIEGGIFCDPFGADLGAVRAAYLRIEE